MARYEHLPICKSALDLTVDVEELAFWRERIRAFLREELLLELNDARERLRPVADGVDFLGYIVRPFGLVRAGRTVTFVAQTGRFGERIEERRPARRWYPVPGIALSTTR